MKLNYKLLDGLLCAHYASALMLLQVGDCFVVNYNNRNYEIEVREAKPGNAISVVEVDCQVGIWASHLMRG